ncbi:hypothetical protein QSH57_004941 [Fusarium oxysporum f. sp. vasinfectum]|nr:hypothetical protein QSH57_004941 [Fusarium oxysporum f. sp. vasinfectum]
MAPRKTRSRSPHPEDRGWVSQTMRKRGMTAIKKNYQFGKDCGTIAVLAFYNKIHGFWDGSVYVPEGESLPEDTNDVIHDIWRRQVVSNGKLVLRPARQRKQAANTKPCRVTKPAPKPSPRVLSLRSRGRQGDGSSGSGASPTQPQIIVAGDGESEAEDDGESIWDVPASPAPRVTRRRGRGNAGPGETATRTRKEARLDACADNAVRGADSTDGHIDGNDSGNGNGEDDDHNHGDGGGGRRREVPDRSEPAELNNAASSHLHYDVPDDQHTVMPYTSMADEDAEGEPWCEPTAPFASMAMNGQSDDAVQRSHGDEPGSVDLTTTMAEDDWMQSALMDFGQVTDFPGAHHWADPHVVRQAPIEAEGGLGDGGLANRDTDAIADAGNDAAKVTQSTAATASDSHVPSAQSKSDIEMQARTPSDETHLSRRSTAATGCPDSSKHTTTAAEDGPQSGHFAGSPLLAIITRALSQMNCYEDAGPDMNKNTSWPMGSHGMIGMPPAMPAC